MRLFATAALGLAAFAAPALAQTTTTTTTVTQETIPAPAIVAVPGTVRTYVTQQSLPSVTLEGPVVVGQPLPDTVEYHVIPDNDGYAYSVVNGQRVIIDPQTRSVIEVYD